MISKNYSEKSPRLLEIEGLRAIAVLAVICNHYFEQILQSGFLGVDVFFVISGFVITKYLTESKFNGLATFLAQFFARRIKRLFPALLFCVFLTSYIFLQFTTRPSIEVFRTGALALVGVSNIFLYNISTDYFSLDARLNPFTHTWSLGVEEQFYLIFPLLLVIAGFIMIGNRVRAKNNLILPLLIVGSLALWIGLSFSSSTAQFYLLPSRIWELGIGSICCIMKFKNGNIKNISSKYVSIGALFVLLAIFCIPNAVQTTTTILCVCVTSLLLCSIQNEHYSYRILTINFLVKIGILSYSLYLWHWSILVLMRWTFGETILAKILCLFLVLIISIFSYLCIERPFRHIKTKKNLLIIIIGVSVATCFATYIGTQLPHQALSTNNKLATLFHIKEVPPWDTLECHGFESTSKFPNPLDHCLGAYRTKAKPHVIYLIGDSHAAQFYWMMQRAISDSKFQLKFVNLATDIPGILFADHISSSKTLDFIQKSAIPGDILVMAIHRGAFNELRDKHIPINSSISINIQTENFIKTMSFYIKKFNDAGIKILLIKDTPLMQVVSTSAACALQIKVFGKSICRVSKQQDLHTRFREDFAYEQLQHEFPNVSIWDPQPSMYGKSDSIDVIDENGNYIMLDWHHISQYQSYLLAKDFRSFFDVMENENNKL